MITNPFTSANTLNPLNSFYLKETIMSEFNLDSLLDGTLDDLADLPEFKPFPVGTHYVVMTLAQKKVGTHPAIEVTMKAIETKELANAEDTPLKQGDETSVAYMLDNEYGQGGFKELMKAAAEKFGVKSNRDLMADLQGAEVLVVTGIRQNKEKTQSYTNIKTLAVI